MEKGKNINQMLNSKMKDNQKNEPKKKWRQYRSKYLRKHGNWLKSYLILRTIY